MVNSVPQEPALVVAVFGTDQSLCDDRAGARSSNTAGGLDLTPALGQVPHDPQPDAFEPNQPPSTRQATNPTAQATIKSASRVW